MTKQERQQIEDQLQKAESAINQIHRIIEADDSEPKPNEPPIDLPPPSENGIIVGSRDELLAAIDSAKGGETIQLKPGNYGAIEINKKDFEPPLSITSLRNSSLAVLNSLVVSRSSGIHISHLDFRCDLSPGQSSHFDAAVFFYKCSNVSVLSCDIDARSKETGTYSALACRLCKNVAFQVCDLHHGKRGLIVTQSTYVIIKSNLFSDNVGDNLQVGPDCEHIKIYENTFETLFRLGDIHPDHIQFHTSGATKPTRFIFIYDNNIFQREGWSQSIFMRDEGGVGIENVSIHNNLILNAHVHGITAQVRNSDISNNSVLWNGIAPGFKHCIPAINVNVADGNRVERNVAGGFDLNGEGLDNRVIWREHYDSAFVNGLVPIADAKPGDFKRLGDASTGAYR